MYRTIVQAVISHGNEMPDRLAVGFKEKRITYRNLCAQMKQFALKLKREYDVRTGDFIILSALSKPEYVVAWLGIQYLGAVAVPVDKSSMEENIVSLYDFICAKLILTDSKITTKRINKVSLKSVYADILGQTDIPEFEYRCPNEQDLAEILFTTGTTGKPKGAMLTYGNLYASTHNTWNGIGMLESDVVLIPLPLNHSVGMRVLRTALYIGATVVLQNGFMFAKELEKNIEEFSCSGLISVPASIEVVYRQMRDEFANILGKLRYIEVGAGSLSYDMKKKLIKVLPHTEIHNTWGSTETGGAIFLNIKKHPEKLISLGKPVEGVKIKVVNEAGKEIRACDIDTAGRMVLQGPMQMVGYYNNPEMTAETLNDGWLYTNDIVYIDEDGFVYMIGRADDIINVGGEKVSPIEVENIAQENEAIRESACIGVNDPDGILGQVPVLFVVLETSRFDERAFIKFLSERLDKYKMPHHYRIIDELPRNRMQKLDRKELYRIWNEHDNEELMNEVILNIKNRRSVREFTDGNISQDKLEAIVQAGIYAPSSKNLQTWIFTVIQNGDKIAKLKEVIEAVAKRVAVNFYGFNNPKVIILVSNDRRNPNSIQDSSCAAENIMLAAQSFGIGSVWINAMRELCDEPEIRDLLRNYEIPDNHIVWATIAMGYPAGQAKISIKKKSVIKWF